MSMVKDLLFAKTSEQLHAAKNRIDHNEKVQQNKLFKNRLQKYWERHDEWCVCIRKDIMTRGNNTNNYSEQAIRITKDIIFDWLKAYNAVQMFHFVTKTMEMYYKRRLHALSSNRLDHFVALRFTISGAKADSVPLHTIHTTESADVFEVDSRTDKTLTWIVDLSAGTCTCPRGRQGQPCAHQLSASLQYRRHCLNKIPTSSPVGRQLYAQIAVGKEAMPLEFHSHFHQKEDDEYMEALGVEPEWKQKNESSLPPQQTPTPEESLTSQEHNFAASQDSDFTISGCLATAQASLKQNMTSATDDVAGDITDIMEDIYKRLESKDDALTAAVREFCKQY